MTHMQLLEFFWAMAYHLLRTVDFQMLEKIFEILYLLETFDG